MSLAQEYLREIHQRHRRNIEDYLKGYEVRPHILWLSVGYFWHGHGFSEDHTFATDEQWEQLLRATGRVEQAEKFHASRNAQPR